MKAIYLLACAACLLSGVSWARAEEPPPPIQLKGIVSFSTNRFALLENTQTRSFQRELILGEGQREGSVSVIKIDPSAGQVTIKHEDTVRELTFAQGLQSAQPIKPASLRLQKASLPQVFKLYQRLARRSLFRSPSLAAPELNLVASGDSDADLAAAIEKALANSGIVLRPEGDKFEVAAKEAEFAKITPQLKRLASTLGQSRKPASPPSGEELIPPGTINFLGLDLDQFLPVYQELSDRTILRPSSLRASPIVFSTYTPLTLTEAIYAFSAVLAMDDVSVLPLDEKFLVVFPTAELDQVTALLSRKALAHEVSNIDPIAAGTLDFRRTKARLVMGVYKELSGQPIEMDDGLGETPIVMRSQNALTRAEALRAVEIILGLNGLTVVQQEGGKGFKVVRAGSH